MNYQRINGPWPTLSGPIAMPAPDLPMNRARLSEFLLANADNFSGDSLIGLLLDRDLRLLHVERLRTADPASLDAEAVLQCGRDLGAAGLLLVEFRDRHDDRFGQALLNSVRRTGELADAERIPVLDYFLSTGDQLRALSGLGEPESPASRAGSA